MPIKFIFDEELEKSEKDLRSIVDFMDEDIVIKKKADVLMTIMFGAVKTFVRTPLITEQEILKTDIKQTPITLLNKLFGKKDIQPKIKKIPEKPKLQEIKKEEKKESEIIQKDLILDKVTNRILANVKITDKYYLVEPQIDNNDTLVLTKVLRKSPKNMEKGWKLITKYGKKFNIQPEHFTNVKYYVVNFLFGLGKIEPLVYDKEVLEIICEGTNKAVKVKFQDKILETNIIYSKKEDLDNFIYALSYRVKQKIKKNIPTITFLYREMNFECTIGFNGADSKFAVKKAVQQQKNTQQLLPINSKNSFF